ncbi:DUF3943 domain-containing protein [Myxococcaceae bacterium GXIMD 01537]
MNPGGSQRGGAGRGARECVRLGLLLAALLPAVGRAGTSYPADAPLASHESRRKEEDVPPPEPHYWLALGEVTLVNLVVWTVDRYILDKDWARVDFGVWRNNFETGFIWDKDDFNTNQFAHPYHGSLYYNAARDNGIGYWGSIPFTALGSLQWEFLAESELPSINDVVNTTLGGISIGEVLYRLSSLVLDNRASGLERVGREVGAGVLNPVRGFNRVVRGDAWRNAPTPSEWSPPAMAVLGRTGYLNVRAGNRPEQFFIELGLRYGDALRFPVRKPFDDFSMGVQFTTGENRLISHAEMMGMLATAPIESGESEWLLLGAFQQFEFVDTQTYEVGGQSVGAGLFYRYLFPDDLEVRAALTVRGVALAGISSEYAELVGRSYDYGPGAGYHFEVAFGRWPWEYVRLDAGSTWIHTLNGASADHLAHEARLLVDVPVYRGLGMGGSFSIFYRNSFFRDFDDVSRSIPQFRLFLSLH